MKRRSKLIFSLISLCFSIAVLCFGVYSALSVSYSISGSVSYEINDVFVELDLSVYRALSTTPVNSATHNQNVSTIKGAGDNISETDFGKLSYTDHESTYEKGEVKPGNEDGIFEAYSPNLALTYGSPTNDNQGYAFYIVIDIHNLGSEIINAQITAPTSLENTILRDSGNVEITANGTERIVLGLALDDVTTGITSAGFTYTITISRGELPEIEPITDMTFSLDEDNKTATLTSYTGLGGDVVIPESIGYDIVSSRTLTFKTMEDMASNEMNMVYFYQDLYITLPNQEAAKHIENPLLWLVEKMESIQATPQDYFPMTIQTVDSYTIDQEEYAEFNQDMATMLAFSPIQMIMQNMPLTSVYVQYGTESFTFNMENYNAYVDGDDSEISKAIDDFMSKMESDPESLLPVTYSNFEYGFAVKGEEYFVTSIGGSVFEDCSNLTSIEIPSSVTSIGEDAFSGTPWLTNLQNTSYGIATASDGQTRFVIDVPTDITDDELDMTNVKVIAGGAFSLCSNLTNIEVPSRVTSIGDRAFSGCSNLTSIEIPSNVTSIGDYAFEDCSVLETVTFGDSSQLESIGDSAFQFCRNLTSITISSSVRSIGDDAFSNCNALGTVTFGDNSQLESIGSYAFRDCFKLTSIEIPDSVTSIGDYAFSSCFALGTVTFGEDSQLESIGSSAFSNCFNLTSIEIPSSVTSIGYSAFFDCYALAEVYNYSTHIPEVTIGNSSSSTNGYLGEYAKVVYNPSDLTGGKPVTRIQPIGNVQYYIDGEDFIALAPSVARDSLTTLTLDSKTTEINQHAFRNCSNLTSIEIPSSVTSIGDHTFSDCSSLKTVTFGEDSKLESIGSAAFSGCRNLTSITIPSSVKSIGSFAFSHCSNLTSIEIPSGVTSIGNYAFHNCSALATVTFEENSQLENIGDNAFYSSNLTSITIPSSVTSIGSYAFFDTPWLTNLRNTSYGIATASDGQTRFVIDVPTDITDDKLDMTNVKVIAGGAFDYCYNLTSITIPSSVKSIGDSAFSNCSALETVTFEDDDSVWVLDDTSNTEISITEHTPTPQELATYLTNTYRDYTWTKKQ